jgi:hypothetical protein
MVNKLKEKVAAYGKALAMAEHLKTSARTTAD